MQNILKQNVIGIDVAKRKLDIYDQKSNRYWVVENTAKGKNPMKMQKSLGRSLIAEIKSIALIGLVEQLRNRS